ncbi:MAG: FAD-dependent oxidoreductase [Candidatus Falkowbacteria bacterium]
MNISYLKSTDEFEELKKTNSFLVLDFYSQDCPPCERLAPLYEKMAQSFPEVKFVKIFRQEHRVLAESLGVSGSPTLLFFKDNLLLEARLSGYIEEAEFTAVLEKMTGTKGFGSNQAEFTTDFYDLCIIGNGPAGLTAAVYGTRYKINQILVGDLPGGLMTSSHKICNFPSELEISGSDLTKKMFDQVTALEVPQKFARVDSIKKTGDLYNLILSDGEIIKAKTILLATGTKHRHLNLENEKALTGRGVSYCATCDAMFFADKVVAVIGGSDSANTAALHLAQIAKHVYQIYRGDKLRGEVVWIDQIKDNSKIEVIYGAQVTEIIGDKKVTGLKLSQQGGGEKEIEVDGVFVEIGSEPETTLIEELSLETAAGNFIITKADQSTSQAGVWAAGDITTNSNYFQQIITACSEGAIAIDGIFKYLQAKK